MNADFRTDAPAGNSDKSDAREARAARTTTATKEATVIPIQNLRHHHDNEPAASANQLNKQPPTPLLSATTTAPPPPSSSLTSATTTTTATCPATSFKVCNICHQEILATSQATVEATSGSQQQQQQQHHHHHHNHPNDLISQSASLSHVSHCPKCTIVARDENHNNQLDNYSNSFLFWKFLSNLPKSITQRSKSTTSTTLAPEVAGYLASKQQCANNSNTTTTTTTASIMTAATETSGYNDDDDDDGSGGGDSRRQQQQRMQSNTSASLRGQPPPAPTTKTLECGRGQLAQDGGQQVIGLMAAPGVGGAAQVSGGTRVAAQTVAQQPEQQHQPQHSHDQTKSNLSQPAAAHATKLSITTTATNRSSVSSLSSCILSDSNYSESRVKWSKKMDFLLSIIGFAVDLANIWRFPYLVYKNGGGVFLIPYILLLIFGGVPLFFLELCLGQFVKKGPITVWNKICPAMKGVGYCSMLISWYVSFYYNILIAWSVYFIYRSLTSFGSKMPWEDCDNAWNTNGTCVSISKLHEQCSVTNDTLEVCRKNMYGSTNVTSPASEFFVKELTQIDQSTGLDDMGSLRWGLVVCALIVYLLHYFSLFRGLETSGKVVWVTATAPYIILSILLVRGLFLPGASMGIEYYLSPKLEKLADPGVWIDAAGQVFYSIGVGFGVHLTYASFNSHHNNCYRDCLMTSAVNLATSVYSGLVVFVYLGYMAKNLGVEIEKVAVEGYSLAFEIYPEALTTLPFARFWSVLFFMMLLTLGLDSAMGGLEAVITGLEDEFKFTRRLSRGQLTALVIVSSFLPALINCTQGGAYTLYWLDTYSVGVPLLFSALFETIGVVYCYGLNKFIANIESMLGRRPNLFYILCWKYISPLFLGIVIILAFWTASVPTYRNYKFPIWSVALGWCLAFSSVSAIPLVAIWHWYTHRGVTNSSLSSPDKSNRKRDGGGSSSAASSSKKSPNHKAISASYAGRVPSGGGGGGGCPMATTTTILTTSHEHQYSTIADNAMNRRFGEEML